MFEKKFSVSFFRFLKLQFDKLSPVKQLQRLQVKVSRNLYFCRNAGVTRLFAIFYFIRNFNVFFAAFLFIHEFILEFSTSKVHIVASWEIETQIGDTQIGRLYEAIRLNGEVKTGERQRCVQYGDQSTSTHASSPSSSGIRFYSVPQTMARTHKGNSG